MPGSQKLKYAPFLHRGPGAVQRQQEKQQPQGHQPQQRQPLQQQQQPRQPQQQQSQPIKLPVFFFVCFCTYTLNQKSRLENNCTNNYIALLFTNGPSVVSVSFLSFDWKTFWCNHWLDKEHCTLQLKKESQTNFLRSSNEFQQSCCDIHSFVFSEKNSLSVFRVFVCSFCAVIFETIFFRHAYVIKD